MIIREASPDDIPALASIAERSYRNAFRTILEQDVLATYDADFFTSRFTSAWPRMSVALYGETLIGFLLMTDGHIDMLFIDPQASGKGAGSALLCHAEEQGVRSLECFRDNHAARSFYEGHSWRIGREYEREFAGRKRSFVLYVKP